MLTIVLLIGSNIIMTAAWYGHLLYPNVVTYRVVLISWALAFLEYCLAVPANRIGYFDEGYSGAQLKILQEVITLTVFAVFSITVLGEGLRWNYLAAFACMVGAVYFIFRT
ncbi:MAG: hypothetical protein GC191_13570 [Azospirillum sp.]|nr:hypothetical protein [Azospirillum sp.]